MERKTIGSFISVLRKSQGLTQKELAEKLGVSDKTVSHWERDESAPDISLIPVIAEIFSVSCDELLRGEKRKDQNGADDYSFGINLSHKSEKQMKHLAEKQYTRFCIFCLIAVAIELFGLAVACITYWVCSVYSLFSVGLFPVVAAFSIISVFWLIISRILYQSKINALDFETENAAFAIKSKKVFGYCIISVLSVIAFTLPELFDFPVMLLGSILSVSVFVIGAIVFHLVGFFPKSQTPEKRKKQIIHSVIAVIISCALVLGGAAVQYCVNHPKKSSPDSIIFHNTQEFTAFMETEKPRPDYADIVDDGIDSSYESVTAQDDPDSGEVKEPEYEGEYKVETITGADGEVIARFVLRNLEVKNWDTMIDEDGVWYEVYTYKAYYQQQQSGPRSDLINMLAYVYYPLAVISGAVYYFLASKKLLKKQDGDERNEEI